MTLTKQQAIAIFGNQAAVARAIGVSRGAIWHWPEQLDQRQTDELIGAATRLGRAVPDGFAAPAEPSAHLTEQAAA